MKRPASIVASALMLFARGACAAERPFDIAPFARRCCLEDQFRLQVAFDYAENERAGPNAERAPDGRYIYGLQWAEERDIKQVLLHFEASPEPTKFAVQYWFRNWPYPPPHMPTIEDPVDDPWQGKWLTASSTTHCERGDCTVGFKRLTVSENPLAKNLPNLEYRRTLKLRLVFTEDPRLKGVEVFSGSTERPLQVRVQLGAADSAPYEWKGSVRVYNGRLKRMRPWQDAGPDRVQQDSFDVKTGGAPKGLLLDLVTAEPSLPGSEDVSVITLDAGDRTFSFAAPDVMRGPIYVPSSHVCVTLASDPKNFSPSLLKPGAEIRERLAREPEQSYERASREIPSLDPVERQGGRLYLPLAADASWQKFAFEWGGNIAISKQGTKAKGRELARLEWPGDRVTWRIGTGARPSYRPVSKDSMLRVLEDDLPIAVATWTSDRIDYTEEGFATLLSGPLSPDDPARSEETPAVLMLKMTARNAGSSVALAQVWVGIAPAQPLSFNGTEVVSGNGELVRAGLKLPVVAGAAIATMRDGARTLQGLHIRIPLEARSERSFELTLPFVPRLTAAERSRLRVLDYATERARVLDYWNQVTANQVPFTVPERRFDTFAKALLWHIRMGVTKDPASGLYMVPAASYHYPVFENEGAFQCILLDALGQHKLAEEYLQTFVSLQGSKPFDGTFTGDQKAVYHGARVNADYDYTAAEYNLDHGTVLWALGEHYFFSRDAAWLGRVKASMERAADWVIEQRKLTELLDHGGKIPEYGLLPAGHLEDNSDWGHWFSVNAFAAAGMSRLAQALADTGDPRSSYYEEQARAYTADIRADVQRAWQLAPVIRLRDNAWVPYVPTRPYQRIRLFGPIRVAYYSRYPQHVLPTYRLSETREVLYGPMILLALDLFHATEPLADWVLNDWEDNATMSVPLGLFVHGWVDEKYWFSRGGIVFQANLQNPILVYLRRNEIPAAIRNLYNDFVVCYYPTVNVFTEEFRQWRSPSGPFYKSSDEAKFVNRLRDSLIREDSDALWLAEGTPRRWLAPGQEIEVRRAPTYFGPVSYRLKAGAAGINAQVQLPTRNPYHTAWLVVRAPSGKRITSVTIDGRPWTGFDPEKERIRLPVGPEPMRVEVKF